MCGFYKKVKEVEKSEIASEIFFSIARNNNTTEKIMNDTLYKKTAVNDYLRSLVSEGYILSLPKIRKIVNPNDKRIVGQKQILGRSYANIYGINYERILFERDYELSYHFSFKNIQLIGHTNFNDREGIKKYVEFLNKIKNRKKIELFIYSNETFMYRIKTSVVKNLDEEYLKKVLFEDILLNENSFKIVWDSIKDFKKRIKLGEKYSSIILSFTEFPNPFYKRIGLKVKETETTTSYGSKSYSNNMIYYLRENEEILINLFKKFLNSISNKPIYKPKRFLENLSAKVYNEFRKGNEDKTKIFYLKETFCVYLRKNLNSLNDKEKIVAKLYMEHLDSKLTPYI